MAIKDLYPSVHPTIDLNFAGSRTVDPRITFSRASTATYFDEFGVMRTVPVDTPRIDFDPVAGECKGLLMEEQRTNLLLNSATLATQNVTVTAVAHTLTFYGTGTVTLSGAATGVLVGTGAANRVALTFTPTADTLTLTVTGICTQGQLEVGAFPTSYIPTTSAQATRAADAATMTGENFSKWYKEAEGTFVFEALQQNTTSGRRNGLSASNGLGAILFYSLNGTTAVRNYDGTTAIQSASLTAGKKYIASYSYGNLLQISCVDGGSVPSSVFDGSLGWNDLSIGGTAGYSLINGHIKRVTFYPKQFTGQQLQNLTA